MPLLLRMLSRLPLPLLHNLGVIVGWAVYLLSPAWRRNLRNNIERADMKQHRLAAIAESGKLLLELPRFWLRPQQEIIADIARVSGEELIETALASGQGLLVLTPHIGAFEAAALHLASRQPLTVLYRRPSQPWLAQMMEQGRSASYKLAPTEVSGVRKVLKALRAGEVVGILPDQTPGSGDGEWAPFFGHPAYTMTLAPRLARGGAAVLFVVAERLPMGAGYHLRYVEPQQPVTTTSALNAEVERLILQCPAQYMWGYNRYKRPAGAPPP